MTGYLDYSGANEVKLDVEVVKLSQRGRWANTYKSGTAHGVHQDMGHADREYEVKGGLISITEIGRLKTLTESAAAVNFRAAITNNADVTVIILDYDVGTQLFDRPVIAADTHAWQVILHLRESA